MALCQIIKDKTFFFKMLNLTYNLCDAICFETLSLKARGGMEEKYRKDTPAHEKNVRTIEIRNKWKTKI